nr:toll/interleukin-1 receptor domain-containing protein [Paenibacillus timonensis]
MRDQIFISHAVEDKEIVGIVAEELRRTFGQDKVFYDSWSMRPGENFVDGMNKGLENCAFFFLFMSETSILKPMVRLEWHNALLDSLNDKSYFIPVRMDNINPPAILMTTLYIDMYNRGLNQTIEDIKSLVTGNGIYNPHSLKPFENLFVEITRNGKKVEFVFGAKRLVEHENNFAFWTNNKIDPQVNGISYRGSGQININGATKEVLWVKQDKPITPHSKSTIFMNDVPEQTEVEVYQILGSNIKLLFHGKI